MKKEDFIVILDAGHGGINPNTGKYVTAGKRAKLPDGTMIYEGVENRKIVDKIAKELEKRGINYKFTVNPNDYRDISLGSRVKYANKFDPSKTLFVSVHNNASGGQGNGFEIFTSIGETKSDIAATLIGRSIKSLYDRLKLRLRFDYSDGDLDKESNFYVLRNTRCPAVLIEYLFFDNERDAKFLQNEKFQLDLAVRTAEAIEDYIQMV